jgi:hypothetical protein
MHSAFQWPNHYQEGRINLLTVTRHAIPKKLSQCSDFYSCMQLCCWSLERWASESRQWQKSHVFNPFTASCENAMTPSVPNVPESCEKFPHSSQLNFWSTESIFNQFSVFLKHWMLFASVCNINTPRQWRVIRSDKPVTLLLLFWSHKCYIGAEPRSRIIATLAVKGLMQKGELEQR